jgi:CHAT domain-containing protein
MAIAFAAETAGAQTASLGSSITQYEQKLASARQANNKREVVTDLNVLGSLYRFAGNMQKALACLNEALPIEQNAGSIFGQATTLNTMGRVYTDLGQEDKALALLTQALSMWRSLHSLPGEAESLNYIGKAYNNLGQRDDALKNLNESLKVWQEFDSHTSSAPNTFSTVAQSRAGEHAGKAGTLDNLGRTYSDMGQDMQALEYYNQALPIWREANQHEGEALTLNNMAVSYAQLGQKQKALDSYNQALAIWREVGSRQGEALTVNYIGRLYRDLGLHQSAIDYYTQALPLWREVGNRNGEAMALSDIGRAYADLHQPRKALEFAGLALPIFRETGSLRGEAMTLNNMGRDHTDLGEPDQALALDLQALALWREVKDQRNEAAALMTLGWAYSALNDPQKSFASAMSALSLAKAAGDPEIEGGIETSIMLGMRKQHHPEEAIFFGLEAVNAYQQIRKNISGLDKELQAGFAQSKSGTYRTLAELLVEAGRLGEAEKVLDLLKEQELKDIVRGVSPDAGARIEPLKLSDAQLKVESELPQIEKLTRAIEEDSIAWGKLSSNPTRTAQDETQMRKLAADIEQKKNETQAFLDKNVFPALVQTGSAENIAAANATQSYLQNTLAKLGPHVMGIRLLLGQDHSYAIVVTATTRKKYDLKIAPVDLREKCFAALRTLGSPSTDPRPQLTALYAAVAAPLEDELKALEASAGKNGQPPTLLWSLDDALRYLPMGALYDGRRYMVERFHNVLFTPESYGHMTDSPLLNGEKPSALAMGLTRSYGGLPALPGVLPELESVVHDPSAPESHGPMEGRMLPDDLFTLAALKTELADRSVAVVHIASHFVLQAGSGDEPYLMMGGDSAGSAKGFEWNLSEMENSSIAFHGTRLLTLSACSTAKDYKSRDGLEMDSLGMIAQQKDAEAVLATLWDVNDASTSRIMSDFYDRWVKDPADGKAEALRQAQLAFIHGGAASSNGKTGRGMETVEDTAAAAPQTLGYAHPYYWAPFVLIGNYQ